VLALIGAAAGAVAGLGAWFVAGYFSAAAGSDPPDEKAGRWVALLRRVKGAIALPAALAMAGMAALGAYLGWQSTDLGQLLGVLFVTSLLLAISLVDFWTRRIPNTLVLALLLWTAIQVLWLGQPAPLSAAVGLAVAGGLFLLLALIQRGAMGLGDVKLAAALGAALGFPLILAGLLYGILAGGLAALVLLVTRRAGRKDAMAYGPYLALGAWIVWTQSLGLWL
jgi:leader peptidase (prepilin peptidase)/N-methyltransferase